MTKRIVVGGMLLSLCLLLPFLTGQIPEIGNMLLPMHLPVMLAGLVLGPVFGGGIGLAAPLLRSLLFGRPILFPTAISMALELCAYGVIVGLCYRSLATRVNISGKSTLSHPVRIYISLLISMLGGRVVFGIVQAVILGFGEGGFTIAFFLTEAFLNALPGIAIQLVLIPSLLIALERAGVTRGGELK